MKLSARLLIGLLSFSISLLLFVTPAAAQTNAFSQVPPHTTTPVNPYAIPNNNPDVPKNLHTWTQTVLLEVLAATACQLSGVDPINPAQKCLGVDQTTGKIGFVENGGGTVGVMTHLIAMTFEPPIHSGDFGKYIAQNFGITKPAYAQQAGYGFASITPLLEVWKAFRDIVFLFFLIIFIVIGLAIMLRLKIDPRTVISIENQVPKIIIGIVLVFLSFPIAGFLIDLMWLFMYLFYGIIAGIPGITPTAINQLNPTTLQGKTVMEAAGGLGGIHYISSTSANSIKDIIQAFLDIRSCENATQCTINLFNPLALFGDVAELATKNDASVADFIIDALSAAAGLGVYFKAGAISSAIPGLSEAKAVTLAPLMGAVAYTTTEATLRIFLPFFIAYIVIFIALTWALFRLWFALITAYISILINIVFAPFWIAGGLIPGSSINFSGWLRNLVAQLSAFPVTLVMFLMGAIFIHAFDASSTATFFVPPFVGNAFGTDIKPLGAIIGLGVILMTPQVVQMMKDIIKAPQNKYGTAVGQAVGLAVGYPVGVGKTTSGIITHRDEAITRADSSGNARYIKRGMLRGLGDTLIGRG